MNQVGWSPGASRSGVVGQVAIVLALLAGSALWWYARTGRESDPGGEHSTVTSVHLPTSPGLRPAEPGRMLTQGLPSLDPARPPAAGSPVTSAASSIFKDSTSDLGLCFRHQEGTIQWYLPQVTGSGVAMADVDGDGSLDLFFVQGCGSDEAPGRDPRPARQLPRCELFIRRGGLEPVGALAGVDSTGCGMAVLAWDYDNDGYTDLAVSRYAGPLQLFRNNGDGTFTELASPAGLVDPKAIWESGLTATDVDRDGFLDLYVGQYTKFEAKDWVNEPEILPTGRAPGPITLLPGRYDPQISRLMRNLGDGRFGDATSQSGLAGVFGQTLGCLAMDLDCDGWQDLMIANDGLSPNRVFINEGGRRFVDRTGESMAGEARGSMGFAACDLDEDGFPDILVTHWLNPPSFYRPIGRPDGRHGVRYRDAASSSGLVAAGRLVGWGVAFLDVDNDGRDDVLQIHGGSNPPPGDLVCGRLEAQPAYLHINIGNGRFRTVEPRSSEDPLYRPRVGRGAAFGDLDRDGTVDVALSNNNGLAEVWSNRGAAGAWIGLLPVGTLSNRDAVGLKLSIRLRAGRLRTREVTSGQSYFSTSSREIVFGLGREEGPVTVLARWPSGRTEEFGGLAVRRYHRLVEGAGRPRPLGHFGSASDSTALNRAGRPPNQGAWAWTRGGRRHRCPSSGIARPSSVQRS